ncbi:MAG: hypothetical protein B7Y02_17415 [Rhodobacterales bacterium 17-64-5]|nr:MAG: hypothetical protein B7Y02_17415 [Rhodobacterales bacterium 17-64-5]
MISLNYLISGRCYGMSDRDRSGCHQPPYPSTRLAARVRSFRNRLMSLSIPVRLAVVISLLASPAFATPPPMAEDAHINDELRAGFAGDTLRKTCPTLSARMIVVMGRLWSLKSYAEGQGYTSADYDAFRSDPVQKQRLKDEAEAYLKAAGAVPGDVETYCKVGEAEIAKRTAVGTLLRSTR